MKVCIETYGCTANVNDSEIMAGLLVRAGHRIVKTAEEAEAVILNTCTVKGPTEDKIRSRVRQLQQREREGRKLIVAGCMAEAQTTMVGKLAPKAAIVGTHKIDEIVDVVEGKKQIAVGKSNVNKAELPKISLNNVVSIIQINEGCLGNCTFCITKLARGGTFSYPIGTVRNAVEEAVRNGCKEIWLTSQDTGAYGLDRRANLAQLLQNVCNVEGEFFIRVGMMNPTLANYLLQPLIDAYKNNKLFKFLHIPLQAGSDKVLAAMKRGYSIGTFKKIVNEFKRQLPQITISTDIICGFPTEREGQFNETLAVVEEVKPDVVNISRFWPRPGTAAAKMPRLSDDVVMNRSRRLQGLAKQIALKKNLEWVGWQGRIIVDEKGKEQNTFVGRNFAYKPVVISSGENSDNSENMLGRFVDVEVTNAEITCLKGELKGKL